MYKFIFVDIIAYKLNTYYFVTGYCYPRLMNIPRSIKNFWFQTYTFIPRCCFQ